MQRGVYAHPQVMKGMACKTLFIVGAVLLLAGFPSINAAAGCGCKCSSTYNGYCNTQRWGWYGARMGVASVEEARRDLTDYYADSDARVGKVIEKPDYFEAEVLDKDNIMINRVIIHKRSGRIRSIL